MIISGKRAVAIAVVTAAAVLLPAAAIAAAPVPRAAQHRTADCIVAQLLIGNTTVRGQAKLRGSATMTCTTRPFSYHAQILILKRERAAGRLRWVPVSRSPVRRAIPSPSKHYTLLRACGRGTFETLLRVGGKVTADGRDRTSSYRSVPITIRACVSGNPGGPPAVAVAAAGE